MHPDIGVSAFESAGIVKRTDLLTVAAAQAPIGLNEYDFHGLKYLPVLCGPGKKALPCTPNRPDKPAGLYLSSPTAASTAFTISPERTMAAMWEAAGDRPRMAGISSFKSPLLRFI